MGKIYFSTNLEFLRKLYGYTQLELANKLGVTEQVISHWEKGRREPNNMEMVGKIAELFNINEDLLFKDLRVVETDVKNEYEAAILDNIKLMTPEEQQKVLAMIDLIRK